MNHLDQVNLARLAPTGSAKSNDRKKS